MGGRYPARCALIAVDLQNDFVSGALPVPHGDELVPIVNELRTLFPTVVLTRDWHPAGHVSFAASHEGSATGTGAGEERAPFEAIEVEGLRQRLWPVHCVAGTKGAAFVPGLETRGAFVIDKGSDQAIDSYSAFYDNRRRKSTRLAALLEERGVNTVFICGLATDYCVKATALDAVALGFNTTVIEDACRGVEVQPGDVARAIGVMRQAGVRIATSEEVKAFAPLRR